MPEMTAVRWWPNGVRRRKTQIFGSEGRGFESCKVFFFPPFSFLFAGKVSRDFPCNAIDL